MTIAIGADEAQRAGHRATTVTRLPGIATAAAATIGAGAIHAGAIGIHAEHPGLARLFVASAVFQLGWGLVALSRPTRWLAALGAAGNLVCVGAWLVTRLTGVSWIGGLEVREAAQFTDSAAAILGSIGAGAAISALLIGWRSAAPTRLAFPALAVAALSIPAMVSGANHVHAHDESAPHAHDTTALVDRSTSGAAAGVVIDQSQPHDHAANGDSVAIPAAGDSGAAATPTSVAIDESQPHDHAAAAAGTGTATAVPTVPYDPTKPIDLGGVPGVTPEQQARAENLVAITLVRLPQWSDPAVAEAAGFHSIGDGLTGFEHYIQWDWINDDDFLNPDRPESLVYHPNGDGTKTLLSAMYMLPDTVTLEQVPDLGGALTQWHIHDNLCFTTDTPAPKVAGVTDANGGCPANLRKFIPSPMIHVWITPHECGPFAALEGVGAGQVATGQERLCDHAHGTGTGTTFG
jgi:hypothetical protein